MISLNVQYLSDKEIENYANNFLNEYHLNEIPIDIEYVVEYQLEMDIVCLPGLHQVAETDGFITADYSAIYIDENVYDNFLYRYRFTLAHEVGHYYMHREYYSQINISDLDSWFEFQTNFNPNDHNKLEYQGYAFAGLLLVPKDHLVPKFNEYLISAEPMIEKVKSANISRAQYIPYVIDEIGQNLTRIFEVSSDVIMRRIKAESLENLIP